MFSRPPILSLYCLAVWGSLGFGFALAGELQTFPQSMELRGQSARHRVLVSELTDGRWADVTGKSRFTMANPAIASVDSHGFVTPVSDGKTRLVVNVGGETSHIDVVIRDASVELPVSFELAIQPILTAQGCSVGACHGKARGQNGFQLSLLCFDPEFDHAAITREARGRRISFGSPNDSLLLRKATGRTPHGGGARLSVDGHDYVTIRRWIEAGAPRRIADEPKLESVELLPNQRRQVPMESQQTLVLAHYSDGSVVDVTDRSAFQSNESAVVSVSDKGVIKAGPIPGEATIMTRFMDRIATTNVMIPLSGEVAPKLYADLPRNNFIDGHVWAKLKLLGITPSEDAGDAKFLRRAYIDIIGRLPTAKDVAEFLADKRPNKREVVIDRLLARPEYADHWANKWADLLRPNPYRVGIKAVLNYDHWIREQFRHNRPYNQTVRDLVSAQGSTWRNGATTLFRDRRSPDELATLFSQLFLGVRLECAKCHHHPFEKWSQDDFYGFAAYFARVRRKGTGLSPPISGGEEIILVAKSGSVKHPLTGEVVQPKPLFGEVPTIGDDDDPRMVLADWMTSEENDYFARVMVNRVWADMMGRGIVEPVDDLRETNPPSNEPLLAELSDEFRKNNFDLKHLIKTIAISRVYSLSSKPTDRNISDTRNYSRHYRVRMRAEVLLDAVADLAGKPFRFSAMPDQSRATQIWTHRVSSIFLDTFGRPDPNQDPPCERTTDSTVTQALHLMNSPEIHAKIIADDSWAHRLASSDRDAGAVVDELYLAIFGRPVTAKERQAVAAVIPADAGERRKIIEDLVWSMLNSPEFLFKD